MKRSKKEKIKMTPSSQSLRKKIQKLLSSGKYLVRGE
jgi:hypothetical protein